MESLYNSLNGHCTAVLKLTEMVLVVPKLYTSLSWINILHAHLIALVSSICGAAHWLTHVRSQLLDKGVLTHVDAAVPPDDCGSDYGTEGWQVASVQLGVAHVQEFVEAYKGITFTKSPEKYFKYSLKDMQKLLIDTFAE